jgi:parallel beta-helix repeat protein
MSNCSIVGNTAVHGSGIFCSDSSFLILENCTIGDNNSSGDGGGIYVEDSTLELINSIIYGNSSSYGGAIYYSNSSPLITRCYIRDNTAVEQGGGIYWSSDSHPTILNCIFLNNSVQGNPNHMCTGGNANILCDLQLLSNEDYEGIHILIYNLLTGQKKSNYRYFETSYGTDYTIQENDVVVISVWP